jgi:O-succinylbenzoic acid--CoA ligase
MPATLYLNGKTFSLAELTSVDPDTGSTPFEKATLTFCRQWLTGEQHFTLHTSGSTGTPKNIVLTRVQMEASAQLTIQALQLKPGGNALVALDTQYIAGKMMLVRSLLHQLNIIAVEPGANPLKNIRERIDFAAFVPLQLERILEESKELLDQVRCAIIGGAPVSVALHQKMQHTTCRLYATYGMTETISHIALQKMNGVDATDFFIVQQGVNIQLDERGCLVIQAPYLGAQPVITNDLAEILSPITFRWLGRADHILNTGGLKVSPEKIEKAFEQIFYQKGITSRFFVGGLPDAHLGQQVVLVMESPAWAQAEQQALLEEVAPLLGKYETPKRIFFLARFAETATGKVNRPATLQLLS